MKRMKILVSNDDGIYARGVVLLANHLAGLGHEVTVVAPDRERSGAGNSISTSPLRLKPETFPEYDARVTAFKCSGTPADCALIGLEEAAPDAELVLSGINSGPNLGCDVFYSGTVAAAREGYFEGRHSIAVSLNLDAGGSKKQEHYETALLAVEAIVGNLDAVFGKGGTALLNVNVPNLPSPEVRGFRMSAAGRRRYRNRVQACAAPEGGKIYWVGGTPAIDEEGENSDSRAVNDGFVALTFLMHDTTDYALNGRSGACALDWANALIDSEGATRGLLSF
ncbi:MAG: 5'/3'-nucleotidase SurE [Synergistaceae bacterium]|jgi:5'-nucleotidase|nr:5'/3'-nucleotidase SurE [Synergistaceae bacterium]